MFLAKGTQFLIQRDDLSYHQILNVTQFTPGATTWDTEDVTNHNSTDRAKDFVTTLYSAGEITLTIVWDATDVDHQLLRTLSESGAERNFKITYPAGSIGTFTCSGFVKSFKYTPDVKSVLKAEVSIVINGAVTDVAAHITGLTVTDSFHPAYVTGNTITLTATFDEVVRVTGTPRIAVVLQSGTVQCTYTGGTNTNLLTFAHTVGSGDHTTATHFSITSPVDLNGGTIKDLAGNNATLTFTAPNTSTYTVN